ncbi:hypothetical protein PINS_up003512 [Pythium insidiosum]|nr:hypothetical protein PINS_up003512 [Pythium insidiosum]
MLRDARDRESDPADPLSDERSLLDPVMTEEWTESHVLRWLREENLEPPTLTRRVEHRLRVVKPLVLKMETRTVGGGRVAITARAINLHSSLTLRVLDLQLHLNQFANHAKATATGTFRIAKGLDEPFPIALRPQEQFNFVFIVEEVSSDVGASESPSSQQQSLLTMTWEAAQDATDASSEGDRLWQPHAVTEHHTIIWSATSSRAAVAADLETRSLSHLLLPRVSMGDQKTDVRCVVRDSKCPLSVSLAPLRADQHVRVGEAIALCVVVANRSRDTEFDLTLVLPFGSKAVDAGLQATSGFETPTAKPQTWLAFEASHHLGYYNNTA